MTKRVLHIDQEEEARFRTLILERSGLHFPETRRRDLERGLLQALEQYGCQDLASYYRLLADSPTDGREWEQLICQLTVGETYFFRNRPQFEALQERILPEMIAQKRAFTRNLRIWSAGCATGEEPYSIAMLLRELLPDLSSWNVTILATDISREALERARAGLYGDWSFREKGWERMKERYFTRRGNLWELDPDVRRMVSFAYLNLVEDVYPSLANNTVAFDLILCRNVTIYFTPEITQRVVSRLYEALIEGGWLVVGHSEPSPVTYDWFQVRNFPGAVFYQKSGTPARLDLSWFREIEQSVFPTDKRTEPRAAESEAVSPPPGPAALPLAAPAAPPDPCDQAEELLAKGQTEEALRHLQRALESDRGRPRPYYLLGKIEADAGHWQEARHWCEQALERDSLLTEAHFLLALIHSQEGNTAEALRSMKRVVYLDRNAVLGHFWLANLYRELGDRSRMHKSLENTIRLLEALPGDAEIPWSDGMTAGRLRYVLQQQANEKGQAGAR